jgi:AGZA family xanthine/uracil permease-like MFS transporter
MSSITAALRESRVTGWFRLAEHQTTIGREVTAGLTTFAVMSYIIAVNPSILTSVKDHTGYVLPFSGVLTATCLVAAVMSIIMGLYTNRAFAIAPGMGLNAVITFGLVLKAGATWPEAMGIVVLEGVALIVLVLSGVREKVYRAIPADLKKAIAIGIGFFIAFIGLYDSGIITQDKTGATPVGMADFTTWSSFVTIFGIAFTLLLFMYSQREEGNRILMAISKASLLLGIIVTTVLATIVNAATGYKTFTTPGAAHWPSHWHQAPDFSTLGHVSFSSFGTIGVVKTLVWVYALWMSDFFDFFGTNHGLGKAAGYLDKEGNFPEVHKPLLVDAASAAVGGAANASSATTFIEAGSGIAVGGRTGLVAVVTGLLFIPFMFFAPIVEMVPAQATAAALVVVGLMMMRVLTEMEEEAESDGHTRRTLSGINFQDWPIVAGAGLMILVMPFSFTITKGLGWGFIAFTLASVAIGRARRLHPFIWVTTAAFVLYFLVPLLQDHVSWI